MNQLDAVPVISSDVIGRQIETEAVLVLASKAQVKVLNETGAFIWSAVDGKRSIKEISKLVSDEFAVDQEQAEQDTLEFVLDLKDKGIVIFS
jgi:hypothetical protein